MRAEIQSHDDTDRIGEGEGEESKRWNV